MKQYCLITLIVLWSYHVSGQKRYDVCYSYGLNIFVLDQADRREDTLDVIGADPELSPDGTMVAYSKYVNMREPRQIMCVDLTSGKTTLLNPCKHCYGPVWSPDGEHIVYNDFDGDQWYVLLLDFDAKTALAGLPRALLMTGGFYSPTWSDDGKKILVQNMKSVFIVDFFGRIMDSIPIARLREAPAPTSSSRYLLSRDETSIIFDMEVDASSIDDSPSAIYVYNRETQQTRKVSPEGYDCFHPVLKSDRIFFSGWKVGDPEVDHKTFVGNIYSLAIDGSDFRLEYKNRRDFSYKRHR